MRDHVLYARLAHYAFARILPLAEKIGEEGMSLRETGLPWLIRYDESTHYSQQMLEQLADFHSSIWRSRIVLMWDYLPSCREVALAHCRSVTTQVVEHLHDWVLHPDHVHIEWVLRMHAQQMATFNRQFGEAAALVGNDDLSSQAFATALTALAQVAMYVLSTPDTAPWEREIQFYQDLYQVFITEVPELEEPEERWEALR
jgi:hypothetical protein